MSPVPDTGNLLTKYIGIWIIQSVNSFTHVKIEPADALMLMSYKATMNSKTYTLQSVHSAIAGQCVVYT